MFQMNPCAPIFFPNLEAIGSSKSSVPTKLHDTTFHKTCPLVRSLESHVYFSTWHKVFEDLVKSQKLSNRVWMEFLGCESCARTSAGNFNFWVASLVLEHQQAILILVCMHLVDVCVVLKPTSVYFLTRGLSQKHFAQVINMHLFISKIKNIYFIHLSLYQAFNKIL